jgi:Phosphomannomutase
MKLDYMAKYNSWVENNYFDEKTIEELKNIAGDEKEIKERFYKDLEFGTGGLRGIIGAGTNRINKYTIRKATQGLADFINKNVSASERKVAIAYDSRLFSKEFANETALVLNANGIKSYLFCELTPTPVLSFAVRFLECCAGVVVTASHNPKEYNGYKVYWKDGAQVTSPIDSQIVECVNDIKSFEQIKLIDKDEAIQNGLFNIIGEEVYDAYIEAIKTQRINLDTAHDLKIVYTPLNGSGNKLVRRILKQTGFENLYVVREQELPDSNFTTIGVPNPEYPQAFNLALELAKKMMPILFWQPTLIQIELVLL